MQGPWPRRGLIAAAVVAVYAAVGFLLAPWLIERTLVGTLDERLSLDTRIENLSLNPFALSLAVDGLAVTDPTGERLLAFERLYVNFQLASLFRWAWSFDEIHLIRPVFTFDRINETQTNLSVLGDKWAATAEAPAEDPEPAQPGENPIPRLRIADLRIVEGHVTVIDQTQTEPFSTDLSPIDLEVAELSTLPDQSGRQQVTVRTLINPRHFRDSRQYLKEGMFGFGDEPEAFGRTPELYGLRLVFPPTPEVPNAHALRIESFSSDPRSLFLEDQASFAPVLVARGLDLLAENVEATYAFLVERSLAFVACFDTSPQA